ncbi:CubicO group peptidase (beta-lactamase class C family) [Isoptericola jiangsuensis]|uniref:CubicO group peptidase (Beta-lactamase class C family) n=1 Tax=Isoptericola jiangsuensis TaxID=548579 RepID=A0A2A9F0J4_9MICO|nr:serine hydrolase domain-containing protein [Isoptericola jiangsuensis]PFG44306.1 CubicO group peptidase (beta-lactamase class C family) [Isoptericola jiangsuensis]
MTLTGAAERTPAATSARLNTAYLAHWVTTQAARHRVPGVQFAVAVDDEVVLDGAWGVTDLTSGTPLRPDHVFRVASHSKTFTATAVARLVDAGELRWDDPLGRHVPELGRTSVGEITVREALGHSGGLLRDGRDADHWQLALPFPDRAALLDAVLTDGEVLGRGEAFKYSNLAYGLLGLVVEAVTGERYDDHVRRELLEPLGLADTTAELDETVARRAVVGHSAPAPAAPGLPVVFADGRLPVAATTTGALAAATGFCSTARDLVRWAMAHCDGSTLLRPETRRLLQREESVIERPHAPRRGYGLGFELRDLDGRRLVGHSGGFPGQITRTWFDPSARVAVSVLTNAVDGPADTIATGLFALVVAALDAGPATRDDGTATGRDDDGFADLDRWTGRFANLWGTTDVVRLGHHLWLVDPRRADPFDGAERLRVDGDVLRPEPHAGFGPVGEPVHVLRDPDGTPSGLVVGGMTSWPADEFERQRQASTRR